MKKVILIASLIVIAVVLLEAWRENIAMDWHIYQKQYKEQLRIHAKTPKEMVKAEAFEIKMRQLVLPTLNRYDRCITCHAGMEDPSMKTMPNPIKTHPGPYLEDHPIERFGCTSCHDGQGRAITVDAAHGYGADQYWEQPLLKGPFMESNCARCHANTLEQTPNYNYGKILFQQRGCFACHSIGDIGGVKGPALSGIGRASFHQKMPIKENRERLLKKFDGNVNLAYLYEAVTEPNAQPKDTLMEKIDFTEDEITAILVYLKSLSSERRVMDVGLGTTQGTDSGMTMPMLPRAKDLSRISGASAKGYFIFSRTCVACHSVGAGDRVGPDLKDITLRRDEAWIKRFIQFPGKMIKEKDPIVMQLLDKYKTPMVDMGLTVEDVDEVYKYLKNPEDVVMAADSEEKEITDGGKDANKKVTMADIRKGMALFQGRQRFHHKGPSCMICHDLRYDDFFGGGRLAKELTTAYSRLGDLGMGAILKDPPFPLMREAYLKKPLTRYEISALLAFLEHVDKEKENQLQKHYVLRMMFLGFLGFFGLLGLFYILGLRRKRGSVNKNIYDRQIKSEEEK
ncbi:MAG: cytochrome c [Chlamydiota bacterium]|nr:cytochrome c [Chlamydiota bacterium]